MAISLSTKNPLSINKRSTVDVSSNHTTTLDFFKIKPTFTRELMPKSTIKLSCNSLTRLEALYKPYYGRVQVQTRYFFVPYRTVWPYFNDFIENTPVFYEDGSSALISEVPYFTNQTLKDMFLSTTCSSDYTGNSPDFIFYTTGSPAKRVFTDAGRRCFDLLRCLGYAVSFEQQGQDSTTVKMSALPLLAYFKVWADWYYNTNYAYPSTVQKFLNFKGGTLSSEDVLFICNFCDRAYYENDKFTSAWDNPVGPNSGLSSNFTFTDVSNNFNLSYVSKVSNGSNGDYTPFLLENSTSNPLHTLTQYGLDALKSLTDFLIRRKLVGSKTLDRYLSEWGIKLPDANLNRSVFIGTDIQDIDVSDVTATSDTTGAKLGDYAGKGIGYSNGKNFSYSTDEFGQIIAITTIVPSIGYVNGRDANIVKHLTPLDFYNGDFDGLGCSPIRRDELKGDYLLSTQQSSGYGPDSIFGWMKRYYEYLIPNDRLTGDFIINSRNEGLDSFHLNRMFPDGTSTSLLKHSEYFTRGEHQYDRIFNVTDASLDHFISIFRFHVTLSQPISDLWETYHFEHEGEAKEVSVKIGGTRLN